MSAGPCGRWTWRVSRALARASGLAALASVASCSVVLDWGQYTGGFTDDASTDASAPDAAPTCSPSTCGGCCRADGVCSPGVASDVCGVAGAACVDCMTLGQQCNAGACVATPPVDSGPSCTDASCAAMGYACLNFFAYKGVPCCQKSGVCGCTSAPGGNLADISCLPRN